MNDEYNDKIYNRCGRKEQKREMEERIHNMTLSYLEYCNKPVIEYKVTYFNPKEECDIMNEFEKMFSEKMSEAGYDAPQVNEILKLYYKSLVEINNEEKEK